MPKTPTGAKRPADVIGNAVHVMRIATGQASDIAAKPSASKERGKKGGKARAAKLTKSELSRQAKKAAAARWKR